MLKRLVLVLLLGAGVEWAAPALAHHSFAVHFDPEKQISVTGKVQEFKFVNPHGVVFLEVIDADGAKAQWICETNSPSLLRRRGWTKDSLKPGDKVTITGWPARDGSNFMRLLKVMFEDGRELGIGMPAAPSDK
jgi:hypothetical protein